MKTAAIALCVILSLSFSVTAADLDDFAQIGAAYLSSLALHEIGHQAAADQIGAQGFPDAVFHGPGQPILSRLLDL